MLSCKKLLHVLGVVRVNVFAEIVVDPSPVTADFIAQPHILMDKILADGIVQDVEPLMVTKVRRYPARR